MPALPSRRRALLPLALLLCVPGCAPQVESTDVEGAWHLPAAEAARWGYPSSDLELAADGTFRIEDAPGRIFFPDITGAYSGHGKWSFEYYQGKPRVELVFENKLRFRYRGDKFEEVDGYRTWLWVGREKGELYLFLWSREEGSSPQIIYRRR